MAVEENKATIRRFYEEGANTRNSAVISELVAADFVGYYPDIAEGLGGISRGPQALIQDLNNIAAMIPDFHTSVEDMVGEGDKVGIRGSTRGTHTGEIPGVRPTGRTVSFTWSAIYRFANGKIVERWLNDDALSTFEQLGLIPAQQQPAG
jgi:predicted ester cyclase